MRTLVVQLGFGEATGPTNVARLLKDLRDRGYINYIPGSGRTSSRYQVLYDEKDPGEQDEDGADPTNLDGPPPAKIAPPDPAKIAPQTRLLNQKTKPEDSFDDLFGEFYEAYPRREGRGQAEKAYRAAVKITSHARIMDGLRSQLPILAQKERKYIKLPATWLNGKCWLDEIVRQAPEQTRFTSL